MTAYHKRLPDYYNEKKTEKSDNTVQLLSDTDNRLWPSHKSIPEDTKEEGQWYYGNLFHYLL